MPTRRNNSHRSALSCRGQHGVTLIEMLVALLVISIGMLGLAGLQNVSLQYNHSSYLRTSANNLAYDIADRMRANRDAARNGRYDIGFGEDPSGDDVVRDDLDTWLAAIEGTLPAGEGQIQVEGDDRITTIEIRWLDDRTGDDSEDDDGQMTFTLRTQL